MDWNPGDPIPRYHYNLGPVVEDVEGKEVWSAAFEELPNCSAQGYSKAEAVERLWTVLPQYLENLAAFGAEIPDPHPQGDVQLGEVKVDFGATDTRTFQHVPEAPETAIGACMVFT